jgi:heme/copper-type cytochrome/quinol oxidase subunit 3
MAAVTHEHQAHELSSAPAPVLPRPRTILVGTAFATGAVLLFFAGLFGLYLHYRHDVLASGGVWIPKGTISLVPGGMMMTTMVMSAVTMQWAVYAIARDDRPRAYLALALTGLFGAAVINQTVFLYKQMHLVVHDTLPALFIYVITGAHLVMLVAAIVFVALMAFRALAGQFSSRQADGIAAAALFWHATVVVYAVIYYAIYITK